MANLMLQGRRPFIYGDGEQRRCFSHVEDCITCLLAMGLTSSGIGEVVNIGPDEEFVSINHLFEKLRTITGTDSQAIHVTDRPQEVQKCGLLSSKARDLLGYRTTRSLDAGLNDIVDYIRTSGRVNFAITWISKSVTTGRHAPGHSV